MSHADFVHLRVHSAYSLSEGAIRLKDLAKMCRDMEMPAVAVTDTNNLFGALEFSMAARDKGIQPIVGCQISIKPESEDDAGHGMGASGGNGGVKQDRAPSVVLLIQNAEGYQNLLQMLKVAYLDGDDHEETAISLETLLHHNAGLILLTGGPGGPIGHLIQDGKIDAARDLLARLAKAYGGRTYVEILRHGMAAEERTEGAFLDFAYDLDLPLVATNECFYPTADMYEAHDALVCIAESAYVSESERRRLTPEHWFKGAADIAPGVQRPAGSGRQHPGYRQTLCLHGRKDRAHSCRRSIAAKAARKRTSLRRRPMRDWISVWKPTFSRTVWTKPRAKRPPNPTANVWITNWA